ncbi:MAG: ATP-binding protein [Kiritimatiellae bacterium]|nr:ATP-binding protein [Kiritimatiellia bacterium]
MTEDILMLKEISDRLIAGTSLDFKRYLYPKIDWRNRFVCLKGAKGTGKTTILRQSMKERFGLTESVYYLSFDHLWFINHSALELVDTLYKNGIMHLFIDEVHHIDHWETVMKNIYDFYPGLQVAYSGSSILRMDNREGDLSRRQVCYDLKGLSFREFLAFEGVKNIAPISLADLLANHREIAAEISRGIKIIGLFSKYNEFGYYPFYKESPSGYFQRIIECVNKVIDSDLPLVEDVTPATIRKTKRMLAVLAESCPQEPNMKALYRELETDRNQGLKMLDVLERADLVQLLKTEKDKLKSMSAPEKIYCDNANLMRALVPHADVGTLRETFFVNQLRAAGHMVSSPAQGDFLVDGEWLFEVGGQRKKFNQIKDVPNSYVAYDDVEIGFGNKIPLWLFGFLY